MESRMAESCVDYKNNATRCCYMFTFASASLSRHTLKFTMLELKLIKHLPQMSMR